MFICENVQFFEQINVLYIFFYSVLKLSRSVSNNCRKNLNYIGWSIQINWLRIKFPQVATSCILICKSAIIVTRIGKRTGKCDYKEEIVDYTPRE